MTHVIHDAPGFRLETCITHHPVTGATLEIFSTWPTANHPDPHRMLALTLPADSFARLATLIQTTLSAHR